MKIHQRLLDQRGPLKNEASTISQTSGEGESIVRDSWGGVSNLLQRNLLNRHPGVSEQIQQLQQQLGTAEQASFDRTRPTSNDNSATPLGAGVGSGVVVKTTEGARQAQAMGRPFVLFVEQLDEANIDLALAAEALIVPHARKSGVMEQASALGKPAVAIDARETGDLPSGKVVTVDGTRGAWISGRSRIVSGQITADLKATVDTFKARYPTQITAEASSPTAIKRAVARGADAVRIDADAVLQSPPVLNNLRRYLMETEAAPKRQLLEQILTEVRRGFEGLIENAGSAGVTIALGTRSPKTYFPTNPTLLDRVADKIGLPSPIVRDRVAGLGSGNSKLGLRGARWGIKDPDLFAAMARAVFEAHASCAEEGHAPGPLSLLVPAVSLPGEIETLTKRFESERATVEDDFDCKLEVAYGAGIETAAGAMAAAGISEHADFAEYGLAEMTETLFGMSADDADSFLPDLVDQSIYPADPFKEASADFLGKMIRVAQYVAGDEPNAFPATIRGPLAAVASGILVGADAGINSLTVPETDALQARSAHGLAQECIVHAHGLQMPTDGPRDRSVKAFDLLTGPALTRNTAVTGEVPEGATPLEHVEGLIRRVQRKEISAQDALLSVPADIVDSLGRPVVDPKAKVTTLAKSIGASPGCGQGRLALSHEKAAEYAAAGEPYVLLINEVHAEDVPAVRSAQALISVRGGKTSHSAMIAANSDVPCVMYEKAKINLESGVARIGKHMVKEGEAITVDGTKGHLIAGNAPLLNPSQSTAYATLMTWADQNRRLTVYANADTPDEAIRAFESGASGVGLVRSEHMFFGEERIAALRTAVLADGSHRKDALRTLETAQFEDYSALLSAADGQKVGVRLLDPPLYEFLPTDPEIIAKLAEQLDLPQDVLLERINEAQEVDSLMGLRGARLALVRPDIEAMQVRALARAYVKLVQAGEQPRPLSIMVPMINTGPEMAAAAKRIKQTLAEHSKASGVEIPVELGAMIETPAAALDAGEIAKHCDFFSYGTNDLTQLTLGFGRNVASQFIPDLVKSGALDSDPTSQLNAETVGKMMMVSEFCGRDESGTLTTGICGAQGSDPASVRLVEALGIDYVSVPPAQVPQARLAAAQARILNDRGEIQIRSADLSKASADGSTGDRLKEGLRRGIEALTRARTPTAKRNETQTLNMRMHQTSVWLRNIRKSGNYRELSAAKALFDLHDEARQFVDSQQLIDRVGREIKQLRISARTLPNREEINAALDTAKTALDGYVATKTSKTSRSHRARAAQAWGALRGLERARQGIALSVPMTIDAHHNRIRHRNDDWDNQHYTRHTPDPTKPMGTYLKNVAQTFLDDNGISVDVVGEDNVPKDRRVVFAVSHRSGAIDRFVTMNALPVDDDKFMYLVREDSPLDLKAKAAYGSDNPWIIPARNFGATSEAVKNGFENGAKHLITYPQGTGTLLGESRYVASGCMRMAMESGAVVVPVTIHDTFTIDPLEEDHVTVRIHRPIDPEDASKQGVEDTEGLLNTLLQYDLGGFRTK